MGEEEVGDDGVGEEAGAEEAGPGACVRRRRLDAVMHVVLPCHLQPVLMVPLQQGARQRGQRTRVGQPGRVIISGKTRDFAGLPNAPDFRVAAQINRLEVGQGPHVRRNLTNYELIGMK